MFLQEFSRLYGLVKVKSLCTYSLYIVVFAKVPVGDGPGKVHNALMDQNGPEIVRKYSGKTHGLAKHCFQCFYLGLGVLSGWLLTLGPI